MNGSNGSCYERLTGEKFVTTAIYPNRERDRRELERLSDLKEGGDASMLFHSRNGTLLARGYARVVYGDHGPYVEMFRDQVEWAAWELERSDIGYYNKWWTKDGTRVMLYEQRKTVADLPNPPAGKRSHRGNRKEGYADYRIGRLYLDPYEVVMKHGV